MRRNTEVKAVDGDDLDFRHAAAVEPEGGGAQNLDPLGTITVLDNNPPGQAANYGIGQTRVGEAGVNACARRQLAALDDEDQNLEAGIGEGNWVCFVLTKGSPRAPGRAYGRQNRYTREP